MGTNYYYVGNVCKYCGKGDEPIHIGKSSAGWCFGLHVYPELGIVNLADWMKKWDEGGGVIKDEYGDIVSRTEIVGIISERSYQPGGTPFPYASWEEFHLYNHSEPGPNGLIRSKVDGTHCIGHGAGTWDLEVGDFT